ISRPGDRLGGGIDREAPRRAEFVLDAALRAELCFDRVDRPCGVVHGVCAVVLEGPGGNLCGLRLESEAVTVDRGWNRHARTHAECRGRASVARRGAAVRLTR